MHQALRLLALATPLVCVAPLAAAPAARPNVLTIVADDVGWGDLGFRAGAIATPALERLAAEGIRLERFYVNPICSPTRASLMTGQFARRTGVNNHAGLALGTTILPQDFHAAGYQTWMCGKWHLGGASDNAFTGRDYQPDRRGFDQFYGFLGGAVDYHTHTMPGTGELDWWKNGVATKEAGYSTDLLVDEAIRLLRARDAARPFYLHLAFNAAHGPLQPPTGTKGRGSAYAQVVRAMDAAIGRLLEALQALDLEKDTLVVFFCDNGAQEGRGGSNGELRGWKGEVFEGGVRSAALLRWPGTLAKGTRSQQWLWVGDLRPTLLSAAGLPAPKGPVDGADLWQPLRTGTTTDRAPFLIGHGDPAWYEPPWKLVRTDGVVALFNLDEDPGEKHDRSGSEPERLRALQAHLAEATSGFQKQPRGRADRASEKGRKQKTPRP